MGSNPATVSRTTSESGSLLPRIQPRALRLFGRRLSLRSPAFHVSLPVLPGDMMLTSVVPAAEGFVLRGVVSEWQRPLSRDDIERLVAAMRAGKDRLDI